jgi:hypothetical protein
MGLCAVRSTERVGAGGESVSQPSLKDKAFLTFPGKTHHFTAGNRISSSTRAYSARRPVIGMRAVTKMTAKPTASASPQKRTEQKKTNVVKIQ